MKNTLIILVLIVLFACQKDGFIPCICEESQSGLLCREYNFTNDKCIGYIDYEYEDKQVLKHKLFNTVNGIIKKSILYEYNSSKRIINISEFNKDHLLQNQYIYDYHYFDSIATIQKFTNNNLEQITEYGYNGSHLMINITIYKDSLYRYFTYQYDSEDVLWKISEYSSDSILQSYTIFHSFSNDILREDYYDGQFDFAGYKVTQLSEDHLPMLINYYDKDSNKIAWEVFEYEIRKLTKSSFYNSYGVCESYKVFVYY